MKQLGNFLTICQHDRFPNLSKCAFRICVTIQKIIFESEKFLQLKESTLIQLLKCDDLKLGEIEIWEYLIKWGIANTDPTINKDLIEWTSMDFMNLEKLCVIVSLIFVSFKC